MKPANREIEIAEKQFETSSEAYAAVVGKRFPIGAFVMVKWGKGWMPAKVFCHPHTLSHPGSIGVRNMESGNAHWKDWRDVILT